MSDEIKTIHVDMKGPSRSKPGGVSVIGYYRVEEVSASCANRTAFRLSSMARVSDENLEPSQASLASAR